MRFGLHDKDTIASFDGISSLLPDEAAAHLDADNGTRFLETVLRVFRDRTALMIRHTPRPLTDGFPVLPLGGQYRKLTFLAIVILRA